MSERKVAKFNRLLSIENGLRNEQLLPASGHLKNHVAFIELRIRVLA
jgi:hypothetical protein